MPSCVVYWLSFMARGSYTCTRLSSYGNFTRNPLAHPAAATALRWDSIPVADGNIRTEGVGRGATYLEGPGAIARCVRDGLCGIAAQLCDAARHTCDE